MSKEINLYDDKEMLRIPEEFEKELDAIQVIGDVIMKWIQNY